MKFWAANEIGQQIGKFVAVGDRLEQLLAHFRLTRQLLRIGIHHLWPLPEGYFFVVIRKRAFRLHPESGRAELVFRFPRGNKPAHNGVCVMEDGTILMGEYVINSDRRHPIALHRSLDGGRSFQTAHTFSPGEVKHIHFVQWDPFAKCVWMGPVILMRNVVYTAVTIEAIAGNLSEAELSCGVLSASLFPPMHCTGERTLGQTPATIQTTLCSLTGKLRP